ncbi:MAG: FHA domain-containing protein [Gemmatimonadota bacterium]|nr:MAG: FHA domain-containing protein [Gemmatimonadota bacterium]
MIAAVRKPSTLLMGLDIGSSWKTFRVKGREARIGRALSNDFRLKDPSVSRHHCRIERRAADWWIEDLESTNGTFLNGELLEGASVLHHGDTLSLGFSSFLFVAESAN